MDPASATNLLAGLAVLAFFVLLALAVLGWVAWMLAGGFASNKRYLATAIASADLLPAGAAQLRLRSAGPEAHVLWLALDLKGPSQSAFDLRVRVRSAQRVLWEHAGTLVLDDEGDPREWPSQGDGVDSFGGSFTSGPWGARVKTHQRLASFVAPPGDELLVELSIAPAKGVQLLRCEALVMPAPMQV